MEKENPFLHQAIMEVVGNQLEANDPPQTRETLERLIGLGIYEEDAKTYIAQAVCTEIYHILKNKEEFNRERFVRNLERLPEEPET